MFVGITYLPVRLKNYGRLGIYLSRHAKVCGCSYACLDHGRSFAQIPVSAAASVPNTMLRYEERPYIISDTTCEVVQEMTCKNSNLGNSEDEELQI